MRCGPEGLFVRVDLISEDVSLSDLCREIGRESAEIPWNFLLRGQAPERLDADLCLWDYKRGDQIPQKASWGTRCFALVASSDLAEFRRKYAYAEPGLILKPVSRAVLRAVITQRIPKPCDDSKPQGDSLRSDRDELLQCLMQANIQLQEFESNRSRFLGRALHDFYAPLTALSGYCGILLEERSGLLTEEQKLIVTRMHRSVRRLSRMSKDMFQLSVGRNVAVASVPRENDIRECVEQALYEVQQLADEKQLLLDVNLAPLSVPLLIDSGQIEQVLINLLENACKFSRRRGSIKLKGYSCFCERRAKNVFCAPEAERRQNQSREPNSYRIDVIDSGPGVSSEQLKSIFEEYVSYAGGRDRSRGGLGLAICRMIIHQHHGRIWAENSEAGAVFSFILPLKNAAKASHLHATSGVSEGRALVPTCA